MRPAVFLSFHGASELDPELAEGAGGGGWQEGAYLHSGRRALLSRQQGDEAGCVVETRGW